MIRILHARPATVLFVVLSGVYLASAAWVAPRAPPTGDEVYYLLAADSFVHGEAGALDARFDALGSATYAPDPPIDRASLLRNSAPSLASGGRVPLHDLGTSLAVALPLALGGRPLVLAFLAVCMAAAVALSARIAIRLGSSPGRAFLAALAGGLSAPALTYSGQVFPDALAAVPVSVALAAALGIVPFGWSAAAVAALPVLHVRYWPLALALLVAGWILRRVTRRDAVLGTLPLAATVVSLGALGAAIHGLALPHAGYLLFFAEGASGPPAAYMAPNALGLVGLFIDRARGLIPAAPVMVVAWVGAAVLARRGRAGVVVIVAVLPYLALASLADWTGAFSPAARYLAPLVGVLVPLLAIGSSRVPVPAVAVLCLWTLVQSAIFIAAPELRYGQLGQAPPSDGPWVQLIGFAPSVLFPHVGLEPHFTLGWAGLLAGAFALCVREREEPRIRGRHLRTPEAAG